MQDYHQAGTDHYQIESQAILDEWDQTLSSYLLQASQFHQDLDAPDYMFIPVDERAEVDALVLNPYNGELEGPGLGAEEPNYFTRSENRFYDPHQEEIFE